MTFRGFAFCTLALVVGGPDTKGSPPCADFGRASAGAPRTRTWCYALRFINTWLILKPETVIVVVMWGPS